MARKTDKGTAFNGAYLGLDPKIFALANYHCQTCGTAFSSNKGISISCPHCGSKAKPQGKAQSSVRNAFRITPCSICASELFSDIEPGDLEKFYCPECGGKTSVGEMDEDLSDYENEDEEVEVVDDLDDADDDEDLESYSEDEDLEDYDSEEDLDEDELEGLEDEDLEIDEDIDAEVEDEDSEIEIIDDEDEDEGLSEDEEAFSKSIETLLSRPLSDRESLSMDLWPVKDGLVRNVIVSGMPVARIHLSDQDNAEQLQDIFAEDRYVEALAEAMIVQPIGDVLTSARARILTSLKSVTVKDTEAEITAGVESKINAFRKRFKETFLAVASGVNRNHFPEVTNSLKMGLWEAMAAAGIETPEVIVEEVFDNNSQDYIDQVFDKTLDLMAKPEEVRQEIIAMVNNSGTKPLENKGMDRSLAKELAQSSFSINMGKVGSDSRSQLRNNLRFRRA